MKRYKNQYKSRRVAAQERRRYGRGCRGLRGRGQEVQEEGEEEEEGGKRRLHA